MDLTLLENETINRKWGEMHWKNYTKTKKAAVGQSLFSLCLYNTWDEAVMRRMERV